MHHKCRNEGTLARSNVDACEWFAVVIVAYTLLIAVVRSSVGLTAHSVPPVLQVVKTSKTEVWLTGEADVSQRNPFLLM